MCVVDRTGATAAFSSHPGRRSLGRGAARHSAVVSIMVHTLKFSPQPPEHPFQDEYFGLTLYLQDGKGELVCGKSVPVKLSLHFEDRTAAPGGLLEVEGRGGPSVGKSGSCACQVRVKGASMDHENRSFVLRASGVVDGVGVEAWSGPMRVMRLRLEIEGGGLLDHDVEEMRKSKDKVAVWYKDEGGREKCM